MKPLSLFASALALVSSVSAQCGAGSPDATVTGNPGNYRTTRHGQTLYTGGDYRLAIQTALDNIGGGQRVAVHASGNLGANTISISSGKIFEGCGTIDTGNRNGRGAIESINTQNVQIPYLRMTGNPYFGLRFSGTSGLFLGEITLNLWGGMGIRFDRDGAHNSNVRMNSVTVTGASSHAVEVWNINGLNIGQVIARDVGQSGLLIQNSQNVEVGLVDGYNVASGTGYATLRFANRNGRNPNGNYNTNVWVNQVISRGGGRGIFCVSESGGAVIQNVQLENNGNNAVLIENCYNLSIRGGRVNGGGEVRVAARSEFANNRDLWITMEVNNNSVRESPCGQNVNWNIWGNARMNVC
ncbi:ricin B lectin:Parallel beta-helix [Sodiomyces alkalinus F11]|uniref:Ricin B lectin:Parallel beta-helix n=1 Tax=Sodiomyces alkalinus (strain CBS 110278 / VKM F-3762 / F11) TaxID=1314773 RepID=A0A3N2PYN8_SODAK|nr:ricin B lectin:Parallel beta-helix [Sodiomyces alkalinus F11]ROT39602.1 ricin B lectin:Parallel beta-helix [Sodiomyces alkalinus F11]